MQGTGSARRRRGNEAARRVAPRLLVLATVLVVAVGCIPETRGQVSQLERPADDLPVPELGPGSGDDAVVAGLVADLVTTPDDLSFWALPLDEATCVAEGAVDELGADRLVGLGFRPATGGAGLADLDVSADERATLIALVEDCVDLTEAVAQIVYGDGRLPPTVATCFADGLEATGQLRPVAAAIIDGTAIDPFVNEGALAAALLVQSAICIPEDAFNWPALRLPDETTIIDADAPPGVSRSPYVGDRTTTTAVP